MNDNTRRKLEKFEREWAFMDKNAVRADLQALIDGFDNADTAADISVIEKAGATGGLKDAAKRGMTNSTKLNGIVRVKYQNNPQQLSAWTVASHLEKPPKKKENPTPPTP